LPTAASYYRAMRWLYEQDVQKKSKYHYLLFGTRDSDILESVGSFKNEIRFIQGYRAAKINFIKDLNID